MLTPAELMQERTVTVAREDLLPVFKEKNLKIEEVKWLLENLSVVFSGAAQDLFSKTTVEELKLMDKLKPEYPQYENFKALLEQLGTRNTLDATNALEWLALKIEKTIKDEYKDKDYNDLGIDF
ncbi:MAG: hypothetical protein NT043_00015 [Candidatus Bathyarchaeota archaeon]|nr:hypothetical protein [Candidatus Bathyarchaeota archaeon]